MLRLNKICKDYVVADSKVEALKKVDLSFRKCEFVSILGPSGCGKTTLLNIIGGLDKYTSGDLYINGRSTKEFKDRDWDVYRNHRIGFIFQSYNLIPHQNILGNVELALTIAGIGKAERIRRAKQALDKVGLKGQYNKMPNQLSGGQCQRVAIARALVNEPEILLADEPTGALDTVTSKQIMELIREISTDRLVIMVTHNPEIAEQYSTRIIRLLDGKVVDDNNPFSAEEEKAEVEALKLETKEKNKTIEAELLAENKKLQNELQNTEKTNKNAIKKLKKQLKENIKALKKHHAASSQEIRHFAKRKKRGQSEKAKMSFFTAFRLSAKNLFSKKGRTILTSIAGAIGIIGVSLVLSISCGVRTFIDDMQNDMMSGNPITISQTGIDFNAMMQASTTDDRVKALKEGGFVNVDSMIAYLVSRSAQANAFTISNTITEEYIEFLNGLPEDDVASVFYDYGLDLSNNVFTDFLGEGKEEPENISLSAIKTIYTSILKNTDYAQYATFVTSLSDTFMQAPNDEEYILSQYNLLEGKVATQKDEIMIVASRDRDLTDLLLAQLGYYSQDEFMNIVWRETNNETKYDPELDKNKFSYEELIGKTFTYYDNNAVYSPNTDMATMRRVPFTYNYNSDMFTSEGTELKIVGILEPKEGINYGCLQSGFFYTEALAKDVIEKNATSQLVTLMKTMHLSTIPGGFDEDGAYGITYKYNYTFEGETHADQTGFVGSVNTFASMIGGYMTGQTNENYFLTLQEIGGNTIPDTISIYPIDFTHKEAVLSYLDRWNSDETLTIGNKTLAADQRDDITYSDNISVIINMINTFIDIVTYALIGFTALSLVVSCVMIAIITYVSVVERTKEIGVIRSLGGRKRDVAYLFNAETFIIGLGSGLIGIAVTYIVSAIANVVIRSVSVLNAIAIFPWYYAVIMVCVSVVLTLLSGLIPSMSAARRDPVVALRTE